MTERPNTDSGTNEAYERQKTRLTPKLETET